MNRKLALDAGQSGVRARILTTSSAAPERTIAHEPDVAEHPGMRTDLPLASQLVDVVADIAAGVGPIDSVAVGLTGFTGDENLDELELLASSGVRSVLLAHDSITSYLGALGAEFGAVVASGTGVVTLAVGASAVARVDGWGNIMGDAGSGYWFGRAALDAAMRAYDGRGAETSLLDRLQDEFADVESAYIELQGDPTRVRRIASFSQWVTTAVAEGDAVSAELCRRGAAELAHSVAAGLDRVEIDRTEHTPVCTIGGVFESECITEAFVAELRSRRPAFRHERRRGDGLDGTTALFGLPATHPLSARITRVGSA